MRRLILFVLAALALGTCGTSHADYGWSTCFEQTVTGEPIPFRTGDTLAAAVWSNDCIHIEGHPVFYGAVITGATQAQCPMDSAIFLGPPPIFGSGAQPCNPSLIAEYLRQGAAAQGFFYDFPDQTVRAVFNGASVLFYRWPTGAPFDSTIQWPIAISQDVGTCIFVNGPLEIKGIVTGKVTIGSAGTLRLLDDIRYSDANSLTGIVPPSSRNTMGIASESDVIIANTPQNGRDNSGMPNGAWGREQTNRARTTIVITAAIEVLNGSFTFEDQNDSASGHVSNFSPDDRGTIYIYGSVKQFRRGYLNRTNNIFTGYQLYLRYDERLTQMRPPCFWPPDQEGETTDTLNFGDVAVDSTVWDTAQVYTTLWGALGSVYASYPFWATRTAPFEGTHFVIPVRFTPPAVGQYHGFLTVATVDHFYQIPLRGRGVPPSASDSSFILHPSSFSLSCFPNPFNARTEIRFSLPQADEVSLDLFDITGRKVATLFNHVATGGEHTVPLGATGLASGVYFVSMAAAGKVASHKILLLK